MLGWVKKTVEKPDLMTVSGCGTYRFYLKKFGSKTLLVYAERVAPKKSEIKYYAYMKPPPKKEPPGCDGDCNIPGCNDTGQTPGKEDK